MDYNLTEKHVTGINTLQIMKVKSILKRNREFEDIYMMSKKKTSYYGKRRILNNLRTVSIKDGQKLEEIEEKNKIIINKTILKDVIL